LDVEKGGLEKKCESCDFRNNFAFRLSEIMKYSKEVIVVNPIPTYGFNVAESYLNKIYKWGEDVTLQRGTWLEYIQPTTDFLNEAFNDEAIFINTKNSFVMRCLINVLPRKIENYTTQTIVTSQLKVVNFL